MQQTPFLGLPLLAAAQAQKHVTHNEALMAADAVIQLHLEALNAASPPAEAEEGARFGLAAVAGGVWSGHGGEIAVRRDGSWVFAKPRRGWLAGVGTAATLHAYDGSTWRPVVGGKLDGLDGVGIAMASEPGKPLAVKGAGALFTARPAAEGGDGSVRIYVNRSGADRVASLLFQTGFQSTAELGLAGGSGFALKVSADGSTFRDAIRIDPTDGIATLPGRPAFRARRAGADLVVDAANARLAFNDAPVNVAGGFDAAANLFRAPVAGVYAFSCAVFAATAGQRCIVDFVIGGETAAGRAERAAASGVNDHVTGSCLAALQAGETAELRAVMGAIRITGGHFTHFSGHLVS